MIAIIDYGVGNLFSLSSSLKYIGEDVVISSDKKVIHNANKLILPGVGAFGDASEKLQTMGLDYIIKDEALNGKPLMGICLGMQLLFKKSFEFGEHNGLGLINDDIVPFSDVINNSLKIPHIGWNSLEILQKSPILKYTKNGDFVYFVHSYFAKCTSTTVASCKYGTKVTAVVQKDTIFGCQFHPEKSGRVGLDILRAFCEIGA